MPWSVQSGMRGVPCAPRLPHAGTAGTGSLLPELSLPGVGGCGPGGMELVWPAASTGQAGDGHQSAVHRGYHVLGQGPPHAGVRGATLPVGSTYQSCCWHWSSSQDSGLLLLICFIDIRVLNVLFYFLLGFFLLILLHIHI